MKSKRARDCDISQKVKAAVWERDGGCCVICGRRDTAAPNAHYIRRSRGGLDVVSVGLLGRRVPPAAGQRDRRAAAVI